MTSEASNTPTPWPYKTLLLCGHFGRATPASRRLNRDSLLALALVGATVLAVVLLGGRSLAGRVVFIGGVTAAAAWTLLAYRRYFSQLDELSLRIQYEAIAFAFGVTLLLAAVAGTATVVSDLTVNPLWVMIAEPLRGIGLVLAARKYR